MINKQSATIITVMKDFLAKGGNLSQLKQVVNQFDELVKKQAKEKTAIVRSAIELTRNQKEELEKIITTNFEPNLQVEYALDPQVIGGIHIKYQDQVLDLTVANSLNKLVQTLKQE